MSKLEGVITMLLKDENGKQTVLNQNPLTKELSITVIDKVTRKCRTYRNKKMICKLFTECVKEKL
jgi:Fe-S-cluster containining protein